MRIGLSVVGIMSTVQQDLGLSDEQLGKLRLFNRFLISYNDFKQADEIASLLLVGDFYRNYPRENRLLVIALNMAAVVAYSRPFLNSGSDLAHSRLPARVLRSLNAEEIALHETVLEDRNTMMAHSDADANVAIPLVMETDRGLMVIPKNASPYATPLLPKAMQLLSVMALKLQEHCFALRQEMEPEVISFLPRIQAEMPDDA
ncbi:MAG: hypothetical protein OEY86_03310 [Nitrospira sp.]|nr:hypothetical protein [Nitrospira sp.]